MIYKFQKRNAFGSPFNIAGFTGVIVGIPSLGMVAAAMNNADLVFLTIAAGATSKTYALGKVV